MRCTWTLILVFVILQRPCLATQRQFHLAANNLLVCSKLGIDGKAVEEPRYRVPFVPQRPGQVWLPQSSVYLDAVPVQEPLNVRELMQHLIAGGDFTNLELQFVGTSPNNMPRDGPFPPTAGLNTVENPFPPPREAPIIPFDEAADVDERDVVTSFIRARRLGECQLTPVWVRLSNDFFPFWYSATACVNFNNVSSCSFPEGLTCSPDVSTPNRIAYLTVLRWDCCATVTEDLTQRVECGWRRVDIPIVVDCVCGCQPKLR